MELARLEYNNAIEADTETKKSKIERDKHKTTILALASQLLQKENYGEWRGASNDNGKHSGGEGNQDQA